MERKYLIVLGVFLLSFVLVGWVPSVQARSAKTKPAAESKVIKIKGLYIGMDIEEARARIEELLGDTSAVVEEVIEGGEKIFIMRNAYKIKKDDLKAAGSLVELNGIELIWQSLIEMGYINDLGRLQDKFFIVEKPDQMEFNLNALKILKDGNVLPEVKISVYNALKLSCIQPKVYYRIAAKSDKKVNVIYFSGGASDKIFNTEGSRPTTFAYQFIIAYIFKTYEANWPDIDPNKVIQLFCYDSTPHITIYSDKSLTIRKNSYGEKFKFD